LEAHFLPHGGCTDAYIRELNKVQNTILVQAYPFTSGPIAKALVNTHKRGVKVEVILDKSHIEKKKKYSSGTFFLNLGIAQAAGLF
jgi:phosphatidylserine/phosphatidylglycerophosphate/cardiolipin synthase-like enzyme